MRLFRCRAVAAVLLRCCRAAGLHRKSKAFQTYEVWLSQSPNYWATLPSPGDLHLLPRLLL